MEPQPHTDVSDVVGALTAYLATKRALCASDADFLAQLLKHRMLLPAAWAIPESDPLAFTLDVVSKQLARDLQSAPTLIDAANQALAALEAAGLHPLVLKGHAFAQTFYPRAELRRATDDDLLISPAERLRGHHALLAAGYSARTFGALHRICGQAVYTKRIGAETHMIDLHWQLGNTFEFFDRFDFAALQADSRPIPGSLIKGRQLAPWHALVHASMHYFTEPVEWERSDLVLLDVALIARTLDRDGWQKATSAAHSSGLSATLSAALDRVEKLFCIRPSAEYRVALTEAARSEPAASLLKNRPTRDTVFAPLRTSHPLRTKVTYAFFQLLPPQAYMRANYAINNGAPALLRAYAARLLKGVRYLL